MKLLLTLFLFLPFFCQAQVYFNCLDECGDEVKIFHDNDYSHFCINDKIYHLCSYFIENNVLRAKVKNAEDIKIIYIDSKTIVIRDEQYSLIEEYDIIKSI